MRDYHIKMNDYQQLNDAHNNFKNNSFNNRTKW